MSQLRAVELIKAASEAVAGYTFMTGTRSLNNIETDNITLPIVVLDRPLRINKTVASGGGINEVYNITIAIFDQTEIDYVFEQHEPVIFAADQAANQIIVNLNSFTDYVKAITAVEVTDLINVFDVNLSGVQMTFNIELYPEALQPCPNGTFVPEGLPPFKTFLTQVAVDGETIIGNGTLESPLIALGGGGGGSLRIQDEGTTVSNAATTINFTGEGVTASLVSPGVVEVNVPASAGGGVESVSGNLVDNTDPLNPVVDAAVSADAGNDLTLGSDGLPYYQDSGSAVTSVNGQTGAVSLDTDDIPDTATNRYTNDTDIARLADTSGTNTGDQDLSGLVPYTGATGDVDLGAHKLAAQAVNVTGTNGNGFIHLRHQATDAAATGQTTSVFADNNGNVKIKNDGLDYATFATNGITNDRTYTFPDKSGTVAMTSDLPPSSEAIVISGNTTAANDATYHVIASAIFTDPTGVNGKGYMVLVRNGTATVGGVAYTQAGTIVYRIFHSGAWQNYAQQSTSYFKSTANGTSVNGTTAQTITYAQLVPAGTYTTGDIVRISFRSLKSGTAGNLTGRVQINTANSLSGALALVGAGAGAFRYIQLLTHLVIKSATVTEIAFTNTARITDIVQTSELAVNLNINWAVDQWILFTVQNGSTADTSNGSFFLIEKI